MARLLLSWFLASLLVGCGGGGGGGNFTPATPSDNGAGAVTGVTEVTLSGDPAGPTMTVKLDIRDGQVFGFITTDGKPIPAASVDKLIWNDSCKGYHSSLATSGVQVLFSNNQTAIGGLNPAGKGNLTLLTKEGKEFSANDDLVKLVGNTIPVTFKPKDETGGRWFIQYGSLSDDPITCPAPPPPPVVTKHEVMVTAQTMTVKIAVEGDQVVNLVKDGAVATVSVSSVQMIVWNGHCVGWVSAGGTGIKTTVTDNPTVLLGIKPSDRGLVSILTESGEYFLNLDFTQVTGDGIPAVVKDGGIWYGDTESATLQCSAPPPPPVIAKHHVKVSANGTLVFTPAVESGNILHLVTGGNPATLPLGSATAVRLSRMCGIWWSNPTVNGLKVGFIDLAASFAGLSASDVVMIDIVDPNNVPYFLNADFVEVVSEGIQVELKHGLIRIGTAAGNDNFVCP